MQPAKHTRVIRYALPGFLLVVFALILVRTAWLCDDAYITFRTVDNFVHGHGLRWNIAERVQGYTHPLWMFLFSGAYYVTGEAYFTGIFFSLTVSVLAVSAVFFVLADSPVSAVLAAGALCLSKAFVDYSTSGLENPLTHLLLAVFIVVLLSKRDGEHRIFHLSLLAGLGTLNRMDTVLLFAPALLAAFWEQRSPRQARYVMLGLLPLFAWEIFSLIYYGFPVPNTAYAKLNTGIDPSVLYPQGLRYLQESLKRDPLTLSVIIMGIWAAFVRKDRRGMALAAGVVLYLAYVVKIGGDFMSGRFLAAPFFVGVGLFVTNRPTGRLVSAAAGVLVLCLGLAVPTPPPLSGPHYNDSTKWYFGVSDERGYYYPVTGLLSPGLNRLGPSHKWALTGQWLRDNPQPLWITGSTGMLGYYAGSGTFILDPLALTDPLLARLPARLDQVQRIGHFTRAVPEGYKETLKTSENHITDASLARYYDQLVLITRGRLLAPGRLTAIWKMNTGQYQHLIDVQRYLDPSTESSEAR